MAFLFSFLVILSGLAFGRMVGVWMTPRFSRGRIEWWRLRFQILALVVINPIAFTGALWSLPSLDFRLALVPLVGLATWVGAFLFGSVVSKQLQLNPEKALLFRTGMSYANIGNLGALAVFLIVGEAGFALLPLYKLFEEIWYYGFLFPHVKSNAKKLHAPLVVQEKDHPLKTLGKIFIDPFFFLPVSGAALGFALHLTGMPRPLWYGPLNSVLVPASSFFLLFAIGLTFAPSWSKENLKPALWLGGLRITALPLFSLLLTGALGFWSWPEVWKTCLVLSAMPLAFLSLVPPALNKLDERFPTTALLVTLLSLLVTLPLFNWLLV